MPRTWFVTGGSRGLGRAIVTYALEQGDNVVATARDTAALADLGPLERVLVVALDVTVPDQVEKATKAAFDRFGHVDVVVNNAGYSDLGAFEDGTLQDFRAQVETNFFGVVTVTKAFLPRLREQGHGHILQVSTIGDRVGTPGQVAYQSAKWAVAGFSTALAQEVGPLGLQITVLEPGAMPTDFAGPSMTFRPVSTPYQPTVGVVAEALRGPRSGRAVDLRRIASVMHDVAGRPDAPLRLLLGTDAVALAQAGAASLAETDGDWRDVSYSVTPRPDASAAPGTT